MGQRLLLVDSDRSFLKEHQVSLEAAFDLEVSASPDGVLSRLESGAFAAVFICVEVADNKGYSLCSSIRKNPKLDGVKIALISAKATEEEYRRHQSLKGKADLYLHKPMAPSALVAALMPLVPGRALDPDNPFGELVDTELGDDWLDGLKNVLDASPSASAPTPVFGVRPPSPVQTTNLDVRGDVPPDSRHVKLLEEQVATLHEELRTKDQRVAAAEQRVREVEAEAQQVQRQLNSVTLNLDELERSNRESESLKARLAETESALRALEDSRGREGESAEGLKAQLKEALTERTDLIQQVETLNHQVGEKSQRAIELLKERDRLLHENMDLEPFRAQARDLEATLASKTQEWEAALVAKGREMEAALSAKAHAMDLALTDKALELEAATAAHEQAVNALQAELRTSREAQDQLNTTLESLVHQHSALEGVHQSVLLEVANQKERAHGYQLEIAGLEATMRGQGRDLAELGGRLTETERALEVAQAQLADRDQQLLTRQEIIHQHQEEIGLLTIRHASVCQELDEAKIQHEGERLELMDGLDHKDAEINRLNQVLLVHQQEYDVLGRERLALQNQLDEQRGQMENQLAEHRERLQGLDALFLDIQDKVRRGSDLTKS